MQPWPCALSLQHWHSLLAALVFQLKLAASAVCAQLAAFAFYCHAALAFHEIVRRQGSCIKMTPAYSVANAASLTRLGLTPNDDACLAAGNLPVTQEQERRLDKCPPPGRLTREACKCC
eukprot:scaffold300587_cov14-Tisochrysis_lutea.AAC.1